MAQMQPSEMVLLQEETSCTLPPAGGCRWGMVEKLPSERVQRGIRVTLDNNSMWREFFSCRTEMIVTKPGSRMFPYCRYRISGLSPNRKYSLLMDVTAVDSHTYTWNGYSWNISGEAELNKQAVPFSHPLSPALGQVWMQSPVSFFRLKLTTDRDGGGDAVLCPNQLYLPRLHIAETERTTDVMPGAAGVLTFTFPQTEFMAVTAYQNSRFTQLKVRYNPFAKGLKEEGPVGGDKGSKVNTKEPTSEPNPLKKSLKSLLANHRPKTSRPIEPCPETQKQPESHPRLESEIQHNPEPHIEAHLDPSPEPHLPRHRDAPKSSRDWPRSCSKDRSAAKASTEQTCNKNRPTQKLFSERIREAHVALQRCNLSQYEAGEDSKQWTSQNGSKDDEKDTSKGQTLKTYSRNTEKCRKDASVKDQARTDVSKENKPLASTASNSELKSESPSDAKIPKRPVTLPLSALGRFLKQHSAKSKKVKTESVKDTKETDSTKEQNLESASKSESAQQESALESKKAQPLTEIELQQKPRQELSETSKTLESCEPDNKLKGSSSVTTEQETHADEIRTLKSGLVKDKSSLPEHETHALEGEPKSDSHSTLISEPLTLVQKKKRKPRKKSKWHKAKPKPATRAIPTEQLPPDTFSSQSSLPFSVDSKPSKDISDDAPEAEHDLHPASSEHQTQTEPSPASHTLESGNSTVLHSSPPPFCSLTGISPAFDSAPSQLDAALPLPSDSALLPVTEGFGFMPLSPASSPEPLPALPQSLTFDLDTSELSDEAPKASDKLEPSVFKWHTVLPPPEPRLSSPFESFQAASVSQSAQEHVSDHATEPAQSFQESQQALPESGQDLQDSDQVLQQSQQVLTDSEQVLPFPGDLSPLTLQFPVSPTFSSLDGDALSPSDLTELVHFFANDDEDLGTIGVPEFASAASEDGTGQTSVQTSVNVQPHTEEPTQQQMRPVQTQKNHRKSTKRKKRRGASKVDLDLDCVQQDPAYSVMKPNLEEVEEQLFISFTSKEALELHIGDSPENSQTEAPTATDSVHNESKGGKESSGSEERLDRSTQPPPTDEALQDHRSDTSPVKPVVTSFRRERDKEPSTEEVIKETSKEARAAATVQEEVTAENTDTHNTDLHQDFRSDLLQKDLPQHLSLQRSRGKPSLEQLSFETLGEKILELEQVLLRDVKQMRHKQVIHPVLQEVGLKMALLDPTLPVDLQYLGIPLPLPPPRANQEPAPADTGTSSAAFVSRTGKTTDMTRIKGWRDKFSSDSALPPEEAPPPDPPPKKNLSAFCSDMLDEYLETEGKLIDERASSFTSPDPAPVTYDLPTHSSSYVRTLNSVLKANDANELISGFVPPSKRPRLPLAATPLPPVAKSTKKTFKHKKKLGASANLDQKLQNHENMALTDAVKLKKLQKLQKKRHLLKGVFGFDNETPTIQLKKQLQSTENKAFGGKTNSSFENESTTDSYDFTEPLSNKTKTKRKETLSQISPFENDFDSLDFDFTEPLSHAPKARTKLKKNRVKERLEEEHSESSGWSFDFDHTEPLSEPPPGDLSEFSPRRRKRRRGRRAESEELELMAPLESDSELCEEPANQDKAMSPPTNQNQALKEEEEPVSANQKPVVTKALVKQRDLELRVFWEGKLRTTVTEERATVALSALFTLKGFVAEDPHLAVRLAPGPSPRCLNDFCRLGCMCASLNHMPRRGHCRRASCMFRCSCLKQKVVLLRNLDMSDSPVPRHGNKRRKKKRRRRRMKMAYVLKEAETVSQPASPVRTLWIRATDRDQDQDQDQELLCAPAAKRLRCKTTTTAPAEQEFEGQSCARVRRFSKLKMKDKKPSPAPDSAPPVLRDRESLRSPDANATNTNSVENQTCARIRTFTGKSSLKKNEEKSGNKPNTDSVAPPTNRAAAPPPGKVVAPTRLTKRLVLLANCKWQNESDRVSVLKVLCEALTLGSLERPFWIGPYFVSPFKPTVQYRDGNRCLEVKVHISTPKAYMASSDEKEEEETKEKEEENKEKEEATKEKDGLKEMEEAVKPQSDKDTREAEKTQDWRRVELSQDQEKGAGPAVERADSLFFPERDGVTLALPFLRGISPAGFMSANLSVGSHEHAIQVNGKPYPLAKVQLGRMGALHPANRLAAYLTGRVGGANRPQSSASPVTSAPSAPLTNSAPATASVSTTTTPTITQGLATSKTGLSPGLVPEGSKTEIVTPGLQAKVHLSPKPPQVLMIQVPGPNSAPVPLSLPTLPPLPPGPSPLPLRTVLLQAAPPRLPLPPPGPLPIRLLSAPQAPPAVRLLRKPDGKLVHLIPISQAQATNKNMVVYRNITSNSSQNTLVPTVKFSPVPITSAPSGVTLSAAPSTAPPIFTSSGLSGLQTFNISSSSVTRSQKPGLSFKILPGKSSTEKVVVRTSEVINATPTTAQPAIETTVTAEATVTQKATENEEEGELAEDLNDLDVICVDAESKDKTRGEEGAAEVVVVDSSSEETVDSSDYSDREETKKKRLREERVEEEKEREEQHEEKKEIHNFFEKRRRREITKMFHSLRRAVGEHKDQTSKISILNKARVVIRELTFTEKRLMKLKTRLRSTRDSLLNQLLPHSDNPGVQSILSETRRKKDASAPKRDYDIIEVVDLLSEGEELGPKGANQTKEVTDSGTIQQELRAISSNEHTSELSLDEEKACDSLSSILDVNNSDKLIETACAELSSLHSQSLRLKRKKERLRREQELLQRDLASFSDKGQQKQQEKLQPANQTPSKTVTSSSPTKATPLQSPTKIQQNSSSVTSSSSPAKLQIVTSSPVKAPPLQTLTSSPTEVKIVMSSSSPAKVQTVTSSAQPLQIVPSVAPPHHAMRSPNITLLVTQKHPPRHRTVPNILSRNRTSTSSSPNARKAPAAAQMLQMAQTVQNQTLKTIQTVQTVFPSGFVMSSSTLPAPVLQRQVLPQQPLISAKVPPPTTLATPPIVGQMVTLQPVLQTAPALTTVALNLSANQQLSSQPQPSADGSLNLVRVVSPQKSSTVQLPSAPAAALALPTKTTAPPGVLNPLLTVTGVISASESTTRPKSPVPTPSAPQETINTTQTTNPPSWPGTLQTETPFCLPTIKTEQPPSPPHPPSAPAPAEAPSSPTKTTNPPSCPAVLKTEPQLCEIASKSTHSSQSSSQHHLSSAPSPPETSPVQIPSSPVKTTNLSFCSASETEHPSENFAELHLRSAPAPEALCEASSGQTLPSPSKTTTPPSSPPALASAQVPPPSSDPAPSPSVNQSDSSSSSSPAFASLMNEIALLSQNTPKTATSQSASPALAPPPLVKLSNSGAAGGDAANKSAAAGDRAWRPMPKLRRL